MRKTVAIIVVLALCVGGFFGISHFQKNQDEPIAVVSSSAAPTSATMQDFQKFLDESDINQLEEELFALLNDSMLLAADCADEIAILEKNNARLDVLTAELTELRKSGKLTNADISRIKAENEEIAKSTQAAQDSASSILKQMKEKDAARAQIKERLQALRG